MSHQLEGHEAFFYYTRDMAKAIAFYRDVVGLKLLSEDEYWSVLALPDGGRFALHLSEGNAPPARGQVPALVLRVGNVKSSLEHLKHAGAEQLGNFSAQPWGEEVDVADLDGNLLRLARLAR
jgi:catechol 2,3-dioxygenase-like lactoylglutathione lyase family enzyme